MNTLTEPAVETERFREDVLEGLRRPRKELPAKYFYDAHGSRLFDRITELEEYYPTRTELGIMRDHAAAMAARCGERCLLIELGAGSQVKVRLLLDHLNRPAGFVPVDVSGEHLQEAANELMRDYPDLKVIPVRADFTEEFAIPKVRASRRVVYFPGSTIGNFHPDEADTLLRRSAKMAGPGGGLLLGVDLRKNKKVLERAYDDEQGVTAAFNLNLLTRINRELGGEFDPDAFAHRAFYNADYSRIEMHLVSLRNQVIRIGQAVIPFEQGETIHTENSYKYDLKELGKRVLACGFHVEETWTDPRSYFAVIYLSVADR